MKRRYPPGVVGASESWATPPPRSASLFDGDAPVARCRWHNASRTVPVTSPPGTAQFRSPQLPGTGDFQSPGITRTGISKARPHGLARGLEVVVEAVQHDLAVTVVMQLADRPWGRTHPEHRHR